MDFVLHLQDHLRAMKDLVPELTRELKKFPASDVHDVREEQVGRTDDARAEELRDNCKHIRDAIETLEQKAQMTHDLVCVLVFLSRLGANCWIRSKVKLKLALGTERRFLRFWHQYIFLSPLLP